MDEDAKPTVDNDPDNPPLTGKEDRQPAHPHILAKIAAHKARYAARKEAERLKNKRSPDAAQ